MPPKISRQVRTALNTATGYGMAYLFAAIIHISFVSRGGALLMRLLHNIMSRRK